MSRTRFSYLERELEGVRDGEEHGGDGAVDEEAVEAVEDLPGGRAGPAADEGGQHEDVGDGEHVAAVEQEDDLPRRELVAHLHAVHHREHDQEGQRVPRRKPVALPARGRRRRPLFNTWK